LETYTFTHPILRDRRDVGLVSAAVLGIRSLGFAVNAEDDRLGSGPRVVDELYRELGKGIAYLRPLILKRPRAAVGVTIAVDVFLGHDLADILFQDEAPKRADGPG
jgi:hypothetical protein